MKYNIPFLLKDNDSASMIVSYIKKGSVVLEFGCANGRMTKYMKQELSCQVYIIEVEKAAFEAAILYAENGICGDIMDFEWLNVFGNQRFDFIIFADVLEHLYDPKDVLDKAKALLNDGGQILASVPNIGHNDIVAKLYMDEFRYTNTGILDNTHVHFFTWSTLKEMIVECGYSIVDVQYTFFNNYQTEQFKDANDQYKLGVVAENLLKWRLFGQVYQYIVCICPCEEKQLIEEKHLELLANQMLGKLYFDYGEGFYEDNCSDVEARFVGDGCYVAHIVQKISGDIKALRYDPLEGQPCLIINNQINIPEISLRMEYVNGVRPKERVLILDADPQIILKWDQEIHEIVWDILFQIPGDDFIESVCELLRESEDNNYALKNRYEENLLSLEKIKKSLKQQEQESAEQLTHKENEASIMRTEIMLQKEQVMKQNNIIETLSLENNNLLNEINLLNERIDQMERSLSWKCTKPLRTVRAKLKRDK